MDLTAKAGEEGTTIFSNNYDEACKVWFDNGRYFFYLNKIKEFPEWFEEVIEQPKQEERIELKVLPYGGNGMIAFVVNKTLFPKDKLPAIKQAIESVLNQKDFYYCHGAKIPFGDKPLVEKSTGQRFFSELAAQQYILDNTPCLSRREMMDMVNMIADGTSGHDNKNYLSRLSFEKVTQKINL